MSMLILLVIGTTWIAFHSLKAGRVSIPTSFWLLYFFVVLAAMGEFRAWVWTSNQPSSVKNILHSFSNAFLAFPGVITGLYFMIRPIAIVKNVQSSSLIRALKKLGQSRITDEQTEIRQVRQMGIYLVVLNGLVLIVFTPLALIFNLVELK